MRRKHASSTRCSEPNGSDSGRLLDVACGTRRHAAAFGSLGWDVTGVDLSEDLLVLARSNAPSANFVQQDMRELELGSGSFDAITCLFDAIGYAVDDEGVLSTLAGFARHLSEDGTLVFEFLHAPALSRHAAPLRLRRIPLPGTGDELVRISETRLDETRGLMDVEFELLELRADGTYDRWLDSQTNRYFSQAEMRALLEAAGLHLRGFVPAYLDAENIDEDVFHVLAVATIR